MFLAAFYSPLIPISLILTMIYLIMLYWSEKVIIKFINVILIIFFYKYLKII